LYGGGYYCGSSVWNWVHVCVYLCVFLCVCVSSEVPAHTDRRNDQACPQQDCTSTGWKTLRSVRGCNYNLYYCRLATLPLRNTAALPRDFSEPLFALRTLFLFTSVWTKDVLCKIICIHGAESFF